jgi:pimeloyl-ACP methyl ester carboxylesterase
MKKIIIRSTLFIGFAHIIVVALLTFAFAYPTPHKALRSYTKPTIPYKDGMANNTPYWFFDKENCQETILISHGRSRHKAFMTPLIETIWDKTNLCIIAIDFPSHGERTYGKTTIGPREKEGVLDALQWLEQHGHNRVFLYGVSMGGSATLYALSEYNSNDMNILGVITDGTYAKLSMIIDNLQQQLHIPQYILSFTKNTVEWWVEYQITTTAPQNIADTINRPLLVLHGNKDPLAPPISAKYIADAAPNSLAFWYDGYHDNPKNKNLQNIVVTFIEIVQNSPKDWQSQLMSIHSDEYNQLIQ